MLIHLAVDCMGGDEGHKATLPACVASLQRYDDIHLHLVGHGAVITPALSALLPAQHARVTVHEAAEIVSMDDSPLTAYRRKRDSSMRRAIDLVADKTCHAVVSSGNTGALALTATLVLRTIDGLERPAIAAYLPTDSDKAVLMLDLGANAMSTAENLQQFALMGSALAQADGNPKPSVGLLNIGEELGKGNDTYKAAYDLLADTSQTAIDFRGNVEGTDIYKAKVDVVVCDGFVGNIALKTSEGLATMLLGMIREEFSRHWYTKIAALMATPVLAALKKRVDHRRYNGAVLLGLTGIVVKSHGSSDATGFGFALSRARDAAKGDLVGRLSAAMLRAA